MAAALCSASAITTWLGMPAAAWVMHWLPMVAAMMLPLTLPPLTYLHVRSLARRRLRAEALFLQGYLMAWLVAGAALPLLAPMPAAWAAGMALAWQLTPAKQRCLNGCHRLPRLAVFGWRAERDALAYGLRQGGYCVGACWALMLPTLLLEHGHLLAMAAVTLFVLAERMAPPKPPAWGWHGVFIRSVVVFLPAKRQDGINALAIRKQ